MPNIIILSKDFLGVFAVFFYLYSLIFWQNCVIYLRHHSYIWMTSSQNVKPYKLHVYDSDKIGK